MQDGEGLLYLSRADVIRAAADVDAVKVVKNTLIYHSHGQTTLPPEAYLGWQTSEGLAARSLALPGAVWTSKPSLGMKIINSSLANPSQGRQRAQGLLVQFDRETAYPTAVMEGAYLSALRTSAYTILSIELLGSGTTDNIAILGCGVIGKAHLRLLAHRYNAARFVIYDKITDRQAAVVAAALSDGLHCVQAQSAEQAVKGADVVVTATTTTTGYLPHVWLAPGALVAHVSLDDVMPDVVERSDLVVVDDWTLVSSDDRRLLGRMYHAGKLVGPSGESLGTAPTSAPRVSATLSDVLAGLHPGRRAAEDVILSNPFGMGILDVALGAAVLESAQRLGIGVRLPV